MQSTPVRNVPSLDSISCSNEDVHQLLTSLPSKTASGPDGISSQMLKMSASPLHQVFSISPCPLALFQLTGNCHILHLFTKLVTPALSPITILFPSYHCHQRYWCVLSTTNCYITYWGYWHQMKSHSKSEEQSFPPSRRNGSRQNGTNPLDGVEAEFIIEIFSR